jgi:hypothetical protein
LFTFVDISMLLLYLIVVPTFAFASLQHQHLAGDKASASGRSSVAEARAAAEEAAALTPHPPLEAPPPAARAAAAAAKAAAAAARAIRTLRRPPLKGSVEDMPKPKAQLRAAPPRGIAPPAVAQAAAPSAAAAAAEPDEAESGAGTPKWTTSLPFTSTTQLS